MNRWMHCKIRFGCRPPTFSACRVVAGRILRSRYLLLRPRPSRENPSPELPMRLSVSADCLTPLCWLSSRRNWPIYTRTRPIHSGRKAMGSVRALAAAFLCLLAVSGATQAAEQPKEQPKQGGILRIYHRDSPGSASIHEGATFSLNVPFMPVFNNLVIYDQNVAQNSEASIVPDLADSWAWSDDKKTLTFKLHQGVTWHDGKPFTSADVKCTFDMLMGKSPQKFRQNPRKAWYEQVNDVTTNGDYEASFNLKRPQPSLLALLASGYTPIYPCHVSPAEMRTHPIGTGPFKFVEFKANESIKLTKNTDYWRKDRPYLDGIEFTIIPNRSTAILG